MKEIGGYIELDSYTLPMLHEGTIALNCGRNALAYLINKKGIKKILLPKFLCASVSDTCKKSNISVRYYNIGWNFLPDDLDVMPDEWVYIVNYYGQISNEKIILLKNKYKKIIVDNSQAYFQNPIEGIDTLYTCRKFFGVSDGAFLYTDDRNVDDLPIDESYKRMTYLLGRYERTASEFYNEYSLNNELFANEPIKRMSKLTCNLLHAIDYKSVEKSRTNNFIILHETLHKYNLLNLMLPKGAYMYPLYVSNGPAIREILQRKKIYIPILWPNVLNTCAEGESEYDMANNILPLPVDQRYGSEDMYFLIDEIKKCFS